MEKAKQPGGSGPWETRAAKGMSNRGAARAIGLSSTLLALGLLPLPGLGLSQAWSAAKPAACDASLKSFRPDRFTSVIEVKAFRKGEDLSPSFAEGRALEELCMVRLLVGPGVPGPADAPSTSPGIGIEVWLPSHARWTGRLHLLGGGGWSGKPLDGGGAAQVAGAEGAVSAITDAGHAPFVTQKGTFAAYSDASFIFGPDGKLSPEQWANFGHRGVHEMAVKTKALAAYFYGRPAKFSYFEGGSNGGRQAHVAAQTYPDDFDGVLAAYPAINWPRFITYMLYPQVVMQQDLGRPLSPELVTLVSSAATSACDDQLNGSHDGFISDTAACRYNPVEDRNVLCESDGGLNKTPACVTKVQALAVNKMWYGQTADGSVPNPAIDNGYGPRPAPGQLWFGVSRGVRLAGEPGGLADSKNGQASPSPIAATVISVTFQDVKLAPPSLRNAAGDGEDGWRKLTYADLARAPEEGANLGRRLGPFYGDNPDLTRFKARGGKMIVYHGMMDEVIPLAGTTEYYGRVIHKLGGLTPVQAFYRYFQVPGLGHFGAGGVHGLPGVSPPSDPPLPDRAAMFRALVDWVEKGVAPETFVMTNAAKSVSRPLCLYPTKLVYRGGDKAAAASYVCR